MPASISESPSCVLMALKGVLTFMLCRNLVLLLCACLLWCVPTAGSLISFRSLNLSSYFGRVSTCPDGSISSSGTSDVEDCECVPGRYLEQGVCELCPANTYKVNVGNEACTACPLNSVSLPGGDSIGACWCDVGYEFTEVVGNETMCEACAQNFYKEFVGNVACLECPANSFGSSTGSSSVGGCSCNAGYEGTLLTTGCVACAVGKYKASEGGECQTCPENRTTEFTASQALEDCVCMQGYTEAEGECLACEPGFYKDSIGPGACTACPVNTTSAVASVSQDACVCVAGYTHDGSKCVECAVGSYKGSSGNEPCSICPSVSSSAAGSVSIDNCTCIAGFYGTINSTDSFCTHCPYDFYCPGGNIPYPCPSNSTSPQQSVSEDDCVCVSGYRKEEDAGN